MVHSFMIESIKEHYGVKQDKELADKLKTSPANITHWKTRGIPEKYLIQIYHDTGASFFYSDQKQTPRMAKHREEVLSQYNFRQIPNVPAERACIAFAPSWIINVLKTDVSDLFSVAIFDGDIAICNSADRNITDGVFAIKTGDDVVIRRIQRLVSGQILFSSDNKNFQSEQLTPEQISEIVILGKVLWRGGKV